MTDHFFLSGEEVRAPYLYKGAGLENVYLFNGYSVEQYDGEEYVSITDVDGLHKEIGRHLVQHRKALSPKEIKFLRNTMGLTQAELAEQLGNNSQSVARWEKGQSEIPGTAERLLRAVFLANLPVTDGALKTFLQKTLAELDDVDQTSVEVAQFELLDKWEERAA